MHTVFGYLKVVIGVYLAVIKVGGQEFTCDNVQLVRTGFDVGPSSVVQTLKAGGTSAIATGVDNESGTTFVRRFRLDVEGAPLSWTFNQNQDRILNAVTFGDVVIVASQSNDNSRIRFQRLRVNDGSVLSPPTDVINNGLLREARVFEMAFVNSNTVAAVVDTGDTQTGGSLFRYIVVNANTLSVQSSTNVPLTRVLSTVQLTGLVADMTDDAFAIVYQASNSATRLEYYRVQLDGMPLVFVQDFTNSNEFFMRVYISPFDASASTLSFSRVRTDERLWRKYEENGDLTVLYDVSDVLAQSQGTEGSSILVTDIADSGLSRFYLYSISQADFVNGGSRPSYEPVFIEYDTISDNAECLVQVTDTDNFAHTQAEVGFSSYNRILYHLGMIFATIYAGGTYPLANPTRSSTDATTSTLVLQTDDVEVEAEDDDDGDEDEDDPCFSGDDRVLLEDGRIMRMADIKLGDRVQVEGTTFEPVYFWSHRKEDVKTEMIEVETESGDVLFVSPQHYLLVGPEQEQKVAGDVRVGDVMTTAGGNSTSVIRIATIRKEGIYAPHTYSNKITVNNLVASCYTAQVSRSFAERALKPFEWIYEYFPTARFVIDSLTKNLMLQSFVEVLVYH